MPSRRFKRSDSRAEEHEIVIRRADAGEYAEATWVDESPARAECDDAQVPQADDSWGDEAPRQPVAVWEEDEPTTRRVDDWTEEPARRSRTSREDEAPRRPVESWLDDEARPLVRGESRTIVLSRPEPEPQEFQGGQPLGPTPSIRPEYEPVAEGRRTIKISGHPDRLPVARAPRPPRTAVERIGTSPDRIAAYAVALGFLLVLIAVLTTGQ